MKDTSVHRLIEEAEELRLDASSIETVRSQIRRESGNVEAILQEAIEGCHARAFTLMSIAALDAEIPVDAAILVHGTRLLPHVVYVAKLGARLSGDVAGALVAAVEDGRLSWEREAAALHFAAWWGEERGLTLHNEAIVSRARMLARRHIGFDAQTMLCAAGTILNDPQLDVLLSRLPASEFPKVVELSADALVELAHEPLPSSTCSTWTTTPSQLRRAGERRRESGATSRVPAVAERNTNVAASKRIRRAFETRRTSPGSLNPRCAVSSRTSSPSSTSESCNRMSWCASTRGASIRHFTGRFCTVSLLSESSTR